MISAMTAHSNEEINESDKEPMFEGNLENGEWFYFRFYFLLGYNVLSKRGESYITNLPDSFIG